MVVDFLRLKFVLVHLYLIRGRKQLGVIVKKGLIIFIINKSKYLLIGSGETFKNYHITYLQLKN